MNIRISSSAVTDRGLSDKRPQNEDSYLEVPRSGIYAVADGVGGEQAGEVASQMAVEILGEAFSNRHDGDDTEVVMRTAIGRANSAIHQMASELPQLSSMATTIVALHLDGNIATIGHVGDSRLYRVDREGSMFVETEDHSVVAEEVRAGRMTLEQAENHPSRNIISRALGAEATVDVDLKTIMIEPGTAFLLCSDGVTHHVTDQEIKGVLTFGGDPDEICEYLKNLCYERGAEDNLTAVVVKVASAQMNVVQEPAPIRNPELEEEQTVATARTNFDDEDSILELETRELSIPKPSTVEIAHDFPEESAPTVPIPYEVPIEQPAVDESRRETQSPVKVKDDDTFSMFGGTGSEYEEEKSGTLSKAATTLAMLVLGSLIGLGVYHFALAPVPVEAPDPRLSVMRTDDIAFSSFEKLRRTVDADPAAFIKQVPTADDAEGYYLIGRAQLLSGDFAAARLALIEAQKQLSTAAPANSKVLNGDIAIALAITNDPSLRNLFQQQLAPVSNPLSSPADANANR